MDLNEILVFARVVQTGSFSEAARMLDMPKSTVSRRISELEERIGARLLQRTTRKLGLTDVGRLYFEYAARIVAEAEQAEQAITQLQSAPRGLLRVSMPLSFAHFGPVLAEFLQKYPDVQVEVICTDRPVDLIEENFDVALRAGHLADSSLVARQLGILKRVLVAAPAYCAKHGAPKTPAELAQHACISFGAGATPNVWTLFSDDGRVEVRVTPRVVVNDLEMARNVAVAGLGIASLSEFVCRDDLREGRLQVVLPDWCSTSVPLQAVYPTARHMSPKLAAFLDHLRARFTM
jgi:DNA-binding transcriptional LysR family regulator